MNNHAIIQLFYLYFSLSNWTFDGLSRGAGLQCQDQRDK